MHNKRESEFLSISFLLSQIYLHHPFEEELQNFTHLFNFLGLIYQSSTDNLYILDP